MDNLTQVTNELNEIKTPKFTVFFDPDADVGPVDIVRQEGSTDITHYTQYRIRVMTKSIEGISEFEVCCEDVRVITSDPPEYSVILGGGSHPRTLLCEDKMPQGIIREIVERDFYGGAKNKRIEVQAYSRVRKLLRGKEFSIILRLLGQKTVSLTKTYQFGDRNGKFYFEEVMMRSVPDTVNSLSLGA